MKKFFKRLSICILIIILLLAGIVGYFYMQSKPYIDKTTVSTDIAISRSIKSSLRNAINQTTNAALTQILQASYNTLHSYNNNKIQNSTKTTREHSIQHTTSIVDISIQIPNTIATQIQVSNKEKNSLIFNYNTQFIGAITLYDEEERLALEETGQLNQEKITEQEGYILSYAQTLDNPFEGIELEAFGEVVQAFNRAINTTEIIYMTEIQNILGYITQVDEETTSIYINPVTLFTGEAAANALAENDPELCESILSGTDQTLCIPPNDFYIVDEEQEDEIQIPLIANEGIQTSIEVINEDNENDENEWIPIDIQTLITNREDNYQETLFSIQFIKEGALSIQEQYIP